MYCVSLEKIYILRLTCWVHEKAIDDIIILFLFMEVKFIIVKSGRNLISFSKFYVNLTGSIL